MIDRRKLIGYGSAYVAFFVAALIWVPEAIGATDRAAAAIAWFNATLLVALSVFVATQTRSITK